MSSFAICLVVILSMGTKADDFMKDAICEENIKNIDSIVELKDFRYFVIGDKVFEYDYKNNFRRRGVIAYDVNDFYVNDNNSQSNDKIEMGKFQSGVFIPPLDCDNQLKAVNGCHILDETLSNTLVVPIYDLFTNTYKVVSKKYNETIFNFQGVSVSLLQEEFHNDARCYPKAEGEDPPIEDDSDPYWCIYGGPYGFPGRTIPTDWLLYGLADNMRHKFLPIYYDRTNFELIVVLNKEYEMFGENPSEIRGYTKVYWKSLKYFDDLSEGWEQQLIDSKFIYTAFLTQGNEVYLIGESVQEKVQSGDKTERGASTMFYFDMRTKKIRDLKKSPFLLFDCSFGASNTVAYIVIGVMILILVLVIGGWFFAVYWFYGRTANTTYNDSMKIEDT